MKLPDFICIGAQKSGTTWLYHELAKHPAIRMPRTKELRWFLHGRAPFSDYCRHFADCAGHATGDITPDYLNSPTAPGLLRRLLPRVKLLAILRDPVERAFSQWRMVRYMGKVDPSVPFIELFRQDARAMRSRGHYADHLSHYLKHFELGRDLQVFRYDDLKQDPAEFITQVQRFLGVPELISPTVHERHPSPQDSDGLVLSPEDRESLQQYYAPHVAQLEERLGRRLVWK